MKNVGWDAFQIFLDVARSGGLTGATTVSGLSAATIGRRMLELEQVLGKSLFIRSQTGYVLTADGRALLDQLQTMESAARNIDGWLKSDAGASLVRIAAGTWNAHLLTRNFSAICNERDDFRIDLFVAEQRASLAHRENDIGIRAFEPEERNLAAIKTDYVAYAAYRLRNAAASIKTGGWRWKRKARFPHICAGRMRIERRPSWSRSIDRQHCATSSCPVRAQLFFPVS